MRINLIFLIFFICGFSLFKSQKTELIGNWTICKTENDGIMMVANVCKKVKITDSKIIITLPSKEKEIYNYHFFENFIKINCVKYHTLIGGNYKIKKQIEKRIITFILINEDKNEKIYLSK